MLHGVVHRPDQVPQDERRQHLAHSAAITDVLLAVDLLARHDGWIAVAELLHERFLHEQRFKVRVPGLRALGDGLRERSVEVVPDAFVRVVGRVGRRSRVFPLIVEVDRDTEQQRAFREKIAALYAFGTSSEYERLYAARTFNVAFFVRAPKREPLLRLTEIMTWTERELRQRHLEHEAAAFSFCALDPATTSPAELLLGANWLHPFSTIPHALIDLSEAEGGR